MKQIVWLLIVLVLGISQGVWAQETAKEPAVESPLFLSAGRIRRNSLTSSFQIIIFREGSNKNYQTTFMNKF